MREIRLQVDGRLNEKSYIRYSFRESEPIEATRYLSTKICTYMYVHMAISSGVHLHFTASPRPRIYLLHILFLFFLLR